MTSWRTWVERFRWRRSSIAYLISGLVLILAALTGRRASFSILFGLLALAGGLILIQNLRLGLLLLIAVALLPRLEISTGTEVYLNLATLLVPAMLALWVLEMAQKRALHARPTPANRPLFLFLLAALLSLLIGNAFWDPAVPRQSNLTLVQLAQWAIFFFSACAFWLTSNLVKDEIWLRRLTLFFVALGGCLAILRVLPPSTRMVNNVATLAITRAPFWALLTALAGGQLLFNRELGQGWRLFLVATLIAVGVYAFWLEREAVATWAGVAIVAGVLAWLRWPRLRWPIVVLTLLLAGTGILISAVWNFAGGEAEWQLSGSSRLVLIRRVIEVTMRNPFTGLGPASYRYYARMKPLKSGNALYVNVNVSSHNNYVDLFSQTGVLGLAIFVWFAVALTRLGLRLHRRFGQGFAAGYVNAMLATWASALVLMMLLDWILPFVYNVGFPGLQASILVWLFLGGLVALDHMGSDGESAETDHAT